MADSPTASPQPAAPADPEQGEARDWGRILDAAGIIAGVALVLIVTDILTDGRLISRRLPQRRPREDEPSDRAD